MTDPFEEAVRAAGRGLATTEPAPSYHGAWKRGRRRKLAKRSAIAVAGAFALVVAFGGDLGRFQGGGTTIEVDDIATESELVPAPTAAVAEPTTAPIVTADADQTGAAQAAPDLDIDAATTAAEADGVEDATADAANGDSPAGSASDESTSVEGSSDGTSPAGSVPAVVATPTPVPPPTPAPTAAPTPVPTAAPTVEPTATPEVGAAQNPDPTPPETATLLDPTEPNDDVPTDGGQTDAGQTGEAPTGEAPNGDTQTGPADADPGTVDTLPPGSPQASTGNRLGRPADARIAPGSVPEQGLLKCDLDGDGTADALCELLTPYSCTSPDQARADYQAVDLNGDGAVETCVPLVETTCDTTGDGVANVTCRIESALPE